MTRLLDGVRRHLPALLLYSILTLILAFPVVSSISSAVTGFEGDNLFFLLHVWWMKHALVDLGASPFFDPSAYYPLGYQVARGETASATTILALPVTALFGPVVAYNAMVLFSFVATGFGTYLWVGHLTRRRSAGLLAGVIAAFMPYRFAHLPGHLPEITTQWIPFTLYFFERFLERRTAARGALVGLSAALVMLSAWYYAYALALILPVYMCLRTWPVRHVWRETAWWKGLATAAVVGLIVIGPFLVQVLQLAGSGELRRSLGDLVYWALNPYDFLMPNMLHPIWGNAAGKLSPRQHALWVDRGVSLGYVALVAALAGATWRTHRRQALALVGTAAVASVIALGPLLQWNEQIVRVPVPAWARGVADGLLAAMGADGIIRERLNTLGGLPIPLPSLLLYYFVPFTSGMRVMARFGLWTGFMTAALAGLGLARITEWMEHRSPFSRGPRVALASALIAGVAVESMGLVWMLPLQPRPVDLWLAAEPRNTVVIDLPVEQALRPMANYWQLTHGQPTLFGWNNDSYPPPAQQERTAILKGFPSPESVDFLKSSGVSYALITESAVPDWPAMRASLDRTPGLERDKMLGEVHVYRVRRE